MIWKYAYGFRLFVIFHKVIAFWLFWHFFQILNRLTYGSGLTYAINIWNFVYSDYGQEIICYL